VTNHIPLVLKYEAWPEADCAAWDSLFIVGDLFDDVGPCQDWSEGSRAIRRQSYGQWLSFICRTDSLALGVAPCERITLERVKAFVGECRERLAPHTVKTHVVNLYVLAKAMAPEMDWAWLNTAAKRLTNKANKRCLPPPHPIDAREIFQWSLLYMKDTAADDRLSAKKRAIHFRQALLIGFLMAWPVRRRTLLAMRVGHHVRPTTDGFTVAFDPEDMKDTKARDVKMQKDLVDPMRAYLDIYRPILLAGSKTDAFWTNQYGNGLTPDGLSSYLPEITKSRLNVALRPHAFRHIAATTIAELDPEHANIISDILGHATLDMAYKHYNRAMGISSCNALQALVEEIRQSGPVAGKKKI
jgi:integrase/recombinase XerD